MNAHLAYFALDVVAIFTALLGAAGFLASQPRDRNARLWAFIGVNTACYILFSRHIRTDYIPDPFQVMLGPLALPVGFAMNLTPGIFMLLAFYLFREGKRLPVWLAAVFAIQVLLEEPIPLLLPDTFSGAPIAFETVPAMLQVFLVSSALWWTITTWQEDLVEERRHLRAAFLIVAGAFIAATIVLGRFFEPLGVMSPVYTHVALTAMCAVISMTMVSCLFLFGPQLFTAPGQRPIQPELALDDHYDEDFESVRLAFERDRIHRLHGLTVSALADKLQIPQYRLRKLIHEKLGFRNFNALLHHHRIKDASQRLISPEERKLPILTIALSVGYQSINPFNRAFREIMGTTPSDYRKTALSRPPCERGSHVEAPIFPK